MHRSLFTRDGLTVTIVLLGVALLVAGAALVYVPAGFIVAGVAAIVAAYVIRYLEVQRADS